MNKKELEAFMLLMFQLKKDFTRIPGLTKLTGLKNHYRFRLGKYRLVFKKLKNDGVEIVKITKRDEQSYKNL